MLPGRHYAKWKPATEEQKLYDAIGVRYLAPADPQRQRSVEGTRDWRQEDGEELLNGDRVSVWEGENIWEIVVMVTQHDDLCHCIVNLEMAKMTNFMFCMFITIKKNTKIKMNEKLGCVAHDSFAARQTRPCFRVLTAHCQPPLPAGQPPPRPQTFLPRFQLCF